MERQQQDGSGGVDYGEKMKRRGDETAKGRNGDGEMNSQSAVISAGCIERLADPECPCAIRENSHCH